MNRNPTRNGRHPPRQPPAPPSDTRRTDLRDENIKQTPYAPPAGFPADPQAWLDYLKAGQFTAEQQKYLQSNAFDLYVAAINSARGNEALAKEVALGDQIIGVWSAWREANPAPAGNPFGGIVR